MKLCLIGSSRFKEQYEELNKKLTLAGHVVYSIATVSTSAGQELSADDKMVLDLDHLRKIAESEGVVLVTDESCYYGFSTRREIIWARMLGKSLYGPKKLAEDWSGPFNETAFLFDAPGLLSGV